MNAVLPSLAADCLLRVAKEIFHLNCLEASKGRAKSCNILKKSSQGNETNIASVFGRGFLEF